MLLRRLLSLLTLLCLICLPPPALADALPTTSPLPGYSLRASPDEIIVYAIRSLKGNIVGYLVPGTEQELTVYSADSEWCYVGFRSAYGRAYGYVPLAFFDVAVTPTPTPHPENTVPAGTAGWVMNLDAGYRLNLREDATSSSASLGKYYTGVPVILTGQVENGFAQVLLAGSTLGWMELGFLTTDATALVPEMPQVTVKHSGATMRSGPDASTRRTGWFPQGTPVTILGVRADGWYHVQVEDQVGYMSDTLLSGTFPFEYGMDSDNPIVADSGTDHTSVFYINTRTSGGQLNLRKSASSSSKSIGLFYTGTPVTILSYTRTGWAYVRIGQTEGYMDADYLTATRPTQYGAPRILRNTRATGLNLRSAPSTGGELLTFVPNHSNVTLLGVLSDGWCYVDLDGALGYMLADGYLKTP